MPFPNEHSARILNPLSQGSAVSARKQIAPGISVILQKNKESSDGMKIQSYRFDKNKFSPEEVRSWLKSHDVRIISFEPATTPSKKESKTQLVNLLTKEIAGALIK